MICNPVHQVWKTVNIEEYSTEITPSHEAWKTIIELQKYTIKLWTYEDVLKLIKFKYAWLLSTYMIYPPKFKTTLPDCLLSTPKAASTQT